MAVSSRLRECSLLGLALLGCAACQAPTQSAPAEGSASATARAELPTTDAAPPTPRLRIPLMLDLTGSGLLPFEMQAVFVELNRIWSQAGICFDAREIRTDWWIDSRLVVRFVAVEPPFVNGHYADDGNIWVYDQPQLKDAPNPAAHPAARTAAHELGHALGLRHYHGHVDSPNSLMASGGSGWKLHDAEIELARRTAQSKGLADTERRQCQLRLR